MNPETVQRFNALVAADAALRTRVEAIHWAAAHSVAQELAAVGLPATAGDCLAAPGELGEGTLQHVAGGLPAKQNPIYSTY